MIIQGFIKNTFENNSRIEKIIFWPKFTSTNENMKAVAYMLDTTAWKEFKDPNAKNESGCHVNNDNGKSRTDYYSVC